MARSSTKVGRFSSAAQSKENPDGLPRRLPLTPDFSRVQDAPSRASKPGTENNIFKKIGQIVDLAQRIDFDKLASIGKQFGIPLASLFGGGAAAIIGPVTWDKITDTTKTVEYVAYSRKLADPPKDFTSDPNNADIDNYLADPNKYDKNEKQVWDLEVKKDSRGLSFSGVQWLETQPANGEKAEKKFPIDVSGFMGPGETDWFVASQRGTHGRGVFYLNARNTEKVFRGYTVELNCTLPRDFVQICPYVLAPRTVDGLNQDSFLNGLCKRWESLVAYAWPGERKASSELPQEALPTQQAYFAANLKEQACPEKKEKEEKKNKDHK